MDRASGLAWPVTHLGRALELLARTSGLRARSSAPVPSPPPRIEASRDALGRWVEEACRRLNLEAESAEIPYNAVERSLCHAGPALLTLAGPNGPSYLALVAAGRRAAVVLGPDGQRHRVRISELAAWLRQDLEAPLAPMVQALVAEAGIPAGRRYQAGLAILRDRFGSTPVSPCWLLRLRADAPFWQHVRQALLPRHLVIFSIAYLATACVGVTAWWIVGRAALEGRFDAGTLVAWTFLLLMLVPLGLVAAWSQGVFAIGAGGLLKLRLLYGALRLEPDETRHQGVGQHLARVIESESIESLMLAAGFSALATSVDLVLTAAIFVAASQFAHLALLLVTLLITSVLGYSYFKRLQQWTNARLHMTQDLVERMVGHRTRLAQEPSSRRHEGEDELLERYLVLSSWMDWTGLVLSAVPRCWLMIGILALAPSFVTGQSSPGMLAVALGAILLSFGALARLTSTFGYVAGAAIAWKQIKPLLEAARRPEAVGCADPAPPSFPAKPSRPGPLVMARDLVFRFRDRAEPALQGCSFRISQGDRIHLSGPSGSGKSTLVSLLTGLRTPASGVLLLDGLDRATLGADAWRRRVVAAPQFHENHVFSETLAFNLLMGRRWPASPEDLELAETVCRRLGLGDLLDRMPGGLFTLVGETGWQLSHGERSRLFMARALLQDADLVLLDESFAELDPESLRHCLTEVAGLSRTLLVVAHT
jgi:ABC-type multidrug transport system fused ATPase/permease subunit